MSGPFNADSFEIESNNPQDVPAPEPAPEPKEEQLSLLPDEAQEGTAAKPEDPEEAPKGGEEAPKPEKSKKPHDNPIARMHKATAEAAQAKREAEEARREAAELRRRIQAQPQAQGEDDPEPKEENFEVYRDFVKAQSRWEARQEFKAAMEAQQEAARRVEISRQMEKARETFSTRLQEAGGQEFLDKISPDVLNISSDTPLGVAIRDSEMAPKVMEYLTEHPEAFQALSGLHPAHVFREIGKIEGKLEGVASAGSAPQAKPVNPAVSKAKPPVRPVSGMASQGSELSDDTPFEEFVARRRAQMRA